MKIEIQIQMTTTRVVIRVQLKAVQMMNTSGKKTSKSNTDKYKRKKKPKNEKKDLQTRISRTITFNQRIKLPKLNSQDFSS